LEPFEENIMTNYITKDLSSRVRRLDLEREEKWSEWLNKIPSFSFSNKVFVTIIPPFGGALARFRVTLKSDQSVSVSVYLDVNESLGYYDGKPYWEIYPDITNDAQRFDFKDTDGVIKSVMKSLNKQHRENTKGKCSQ
jgi:hypothetical protein